MALREAVCRNCVSEFTYQAKGGVDRPLCHECEETYKWCPACGYAIVHAGFGRDPRQRVGLEGNCKQCKTRQFRHRVQRGYRANPRSIRLSKIKARYGLSEADWDALVVDQLGRCAICTVATPDLVVDHCHSTGRVRGLLCSPCNKGLGHFSDETGRMKAAINYLLEKTEG